MTALRLLFVGTALATYGLVVLGGIVRATDSGLACPDWPLCHGELIPPLESHVLIEYSHRLAAATVGLLVLATAAVAWLSFRQVRAIILPAALAVALLAGQVVVGGITVLRELPATLVVLHLALAMALLAVLVVGAIAAFLGERAGPADGPGAAWVGRGTFPHLALVAALATFALIVTGSYVVGSGAGLAFSDWPLFNGKLLAEGGRLAQVHFLHRLAAAAVGIIIALVLVQAWRWQRHSPALLMVATAAFVLYLAQVMLGAGNIWWRLAPAVRAAHLAMAAGLWTSLVALASLAYYQARPVPAGVRVLERGR